MGAGHFGHRTLRHQDTSAPHRITKIALLAYNYQSRREEGEGGQATPAALSRGRHFEEDKKFSACVQSFKCFTAPSATDPRAATDNYMASTRPTLNCMLVFVRGIV